MEREKIIKALECCSKDDCDNCPNTFGNCYSNLSGYALALINELINEADNYKAVAEYQQSSNMSRWFELREKDRENYRLISEIDRLTEENERLRERADRHLENLKSVLDERSESNIEADTVRKMQERLKTGWCADSKKCCEFIDQIAKELLEGNDGK